MSARSSSPAKSPDLPVSSATHAPEKNGGSADLPEDKILIEAIRSGDQPLVERLIDRWSPMMLRMARRFARSEAVAEEIVQETWMAVVRSIDRFEGRSTLRSWALSILANRAQSIAGREARTVPFTDLGLEGDLRDPLSPEDRALLRPNGSLPPGVLPADPNWADRLVHSGEIRKALEQAIERLPPNQKAVLLMADVEGVPSEEVCNALGVNETNRRVLLHRARMKIRRALHEFASGS